jgi:NADH-quinone oxidoreductase subunit F
VPGGSSVPILPADLIFKTANGEDRLMTYESLSDGGFATGSMLGSGGFIVYNDTFIVRNMEFFSFYHHSLADNVHLVARDRMVRKVLHRSKLVLVVKRILICCEYSIKIEGNTICPLGDAASWPVAAAIVTLEKNLNTMFVLKRIK